MEGNTPGRGSGVPGEETEGLKNYFMTPSDKELVRGARERFHLIEELDQVNREIRVIINEISQFDELTDEIEERFGELEWRDKEIAQWTA